MAREDAAAGGDASEATVGEPGDGGPRCGFICVLGAPNVGKSTLVNRLVGAKVSIVSPKVQTTRARVLGIAMAGESQLLLVDTPGLFQPRQRLDQAMVSAAWEGTADADAIVLLVDSARGAGDGEARVVDWLRGRGRQAILVLNKVDAVDKRRLLALAQTLNGAGVFAETFMISALTGDGVADLTAQFARIVPPGPWLYPADQLSDMPQALLAAEITREKAFWRLQQELPYAIAVETEAWAAFDDGSVRIDQTIWVERDGQRGIVIGKNGQRLKEIGALARHEMETAFERRVHLFLHVKVRPDWKNNPVFYRLHGLPFPGGGASH